jgi:hypothetical protein
MLAKIPDKISSNLYKKFGQFDILTGMVMRSYVFRDLTLCIPLEVN